MAIPLAAILKAMPAILEATSAIATSVRNRRDTGAVRTEERIRKAEDDIVALAGTLTRAAEEIQSLAQNLGAHAIRLEALERRLKLVQGGAMAALVLGLVALVVAIWH